jgi:DNA-binding CsgD family transcriptional regulator
MGALAIAGRAEAVAPRYEAARTIHRFLSFGTFGPLELGRAAALLRRWNEAEAHFRAGLHVADEEGLVLLTPMLLRERGNAYLRRGRRGDRSRAAADLRGARDCFQALGLSTLAAAIEQTIGSLERGLPDRLPGGLTQREAEVLRLVASGHSNRQIAEDLVISEKTVEQHLLNIYQKLQVDNRSGAVAFAFAHGLAAPSPFENV